MRWQSKNRTQLTYLNNLSFIFISDVGARHCAVSICNDMRYHINYAGYIIHNSKIGIDAPNNCGLR